MKKEGWLAKEDYEEPVCLLDGIPDKPRNVKPVPQQRIMEKVEEYMSRRDYASVERHLLYWLEEAKLGNDERGELMIRNELIGHYRKSGKREEAFRSCPPEKAKMVMIRIHPIMITGKQNT